MNAFDYWFDYIKRNGEFCPLVEKGEILNLKWKIVINNNSVYYAVLTKSIKKIHGWTREKPVGRCFSKENFDIHNSIFKDITRPIL